MTANREAEMKETDTPTPFPVMTSPQGRAHPTTIPWSVADLAYSVYSKKYGHRQSLKKLAVRGGFWSGEMDELLPDWRERCSEITALRAELSAKSAELTKAQAALAEQEGYVRVPKEPTEDELRAISLALREMHGSRYAYDTDAARYVRDAMIAARSTTDEANPPVTENGGGGWREKIIEKCAKFICTTCRDAPEYTLRLSKYGAWGHLCGEAFLPCAASEMRNSFLPKQHDHRKLRERSD